MEFFSNEEKALIAARVDKEMAWAADVVNANDPNNPWTATAEMVMRVGRDERLKAILRSRKKYEMDLQSNLLTSKRIGRSKGLAEGREEGRIEGKAEGRLEGIIEGRIEGAISVAMNLLSTDFSISHTANLTGLTCIEIENTRNLIKRFSDELGIPEKEVFTSKEIMATNLRFTIVSEFIKARNERGGLEKTEQFNCED